MSWEDAVAFCERLSEREGESYRLPTEAEWEYACRAGTTTRYSFGDDVSELGDYAWLSENARNRGERYAHQVAQKKPNPFRLYDMHGNVWEWCLDWYDKDYYANSPTEDPKGPASGSFRVLRGGCWFFPAWLCQSSFRLRVPPSSRDYFLGFRVARGPAE